MKIGSFFTVAKAATSNEDCSASGDIFLPFGTASSLDTSILVASANVEGAATVTMEEIRGWM